MKKESPKNQKTGSDLKNNENFHITRDTKKTLKRGKNEKTKSI